MCRPVVLIAFLVSVIVAATARADIVQNGSFELFGGVGNSNIGAGLDHWTIGGGGIDIMEPSASNYWLAADGDVSLSLNWFTAGSVSQDLSTVAGQAYEVRFWMAAEIYGGQPLRSLNVTWNGSVVSSPSFTYSGQGPNNMGWTQYTCVVQGTGLDTLAFVSTTPANYGPALDNVSVVPVPEPGAGALLGVCALSAFRRRR